MVRRDEDDRQLPLPWAAAALLPLPMCIGVVTMDLMIHDDKL